MGKLTAVAVAMTLASAKKECADNTEPTFCMTAGETPTCDNAETALGLTAGSLTADLKDEKKWQCLDADDKKVGEKPACDDGSKPEYCQDGTEPVKEEKDASDSSESTESDDSDDGKKGDAGDEKKQEESSCADDGPANYCQTAVDKDDKKEGNYECQLNGEKVKGAKAECADGSKPKYCSDGVDPNAKAPKKGGPKGDADDCKKHELTCENGTLQKVEVTTRRRPGKKGPKGKQEEKCVDETTGDIEDSQAARTMLVTLRSRIQGLVRGDVQYA